jgi:GT2 family glycosyltransferase
MRILILVVLYRTSPQESKTLRQLAVQECGAGHTYDLLVWDNSPEPCNAESQAWMNEMFQTIEYRSTPANIPLSDIYTATIRMLLSSVAPYDFLMLFDQDSNLSKDFIQNMLEATEMWPDVGMYLPTVRAASHFVSPASLHWFKGSFWTHPRKGLVSSRFTTAINSGMLLRAGFLRDHFHGFPQGILLYGTDTWLCQKYAQFYSHVCVADIVMDHGLSQFEVEDVEKKLWRHREIVRSTYVLNRQNPLRATLCLAYLFFQSLRAAFKFRDMRFLSCRN